MQFSDTFLYFVFFEGLYTSMFELLGEINGILLVIIHGR